MISNEGSTRGSFNLFSIPKATDVDKIRRTTKDYKWMYKLLVALGSGGGANDNDSTSSTLYNLLTYFVRSAFYKETQEKVVTENGYSFPKIDECGTKAIQSMCNLNGRQMKLLRSCLCLELGSPIFATHNKVNTILNLEYVEPTVGSYKYGSEKILYSYRCQ